MTADEFLDLNPGVVLKFGRSSEDGTWWADAREEQGRFIAAHGYKRSLAEALSALHGDCQRRSLPPMKTHGISLRRKALLPDELRRDVNYGLARDLEPDDSSDAADVA